MLQTPLLGGSSPEVSHLPRSFVSSKSPPWKGEVSDLYHTLKDIITSSDFDSVPCTVYDTVYARIPPGFDLSIRSKKEGKTLMKCGM